MSAILWAASFAAFGVVLRCLCCYGPSECGGTCRGGTKRTRMTVVITGFEDDEPGCDAAAEVNCNSLNATYVLPFTVDGGIGSIAPGCFYAKVHEFCGKSTSVGFPPVTTTVVEVVSIGGRVYTAGGQAKIDVWTVGQSTTGIIPVSTNGFSHRWRSADLGAVTQDCRELGDDIECEPVAAGFPVIPNPAYCDDAGTSCEVTLSNPP